MKFLSIDDSKAVHAYLKQCFNDIPHQLDHAYNGEEGIEKCNSGTYDLILLDWEMPGLTGPEVLEKLRKKGLSCPIVMLTTKNAVEDIAMVLEKGATEYVMKPFTPEILIDKLETVLNSKLR